MSLSVKGEPIHNFIGERNILSIEVKCDVEKYAFMSQLSGRRGTWATVVSEVIRLPGVVEFPAL